MYNAFNLTTPAQNDAALEQIIREHASLQTFPPKKVILEAEAPASGVYYILSGRARLYLLGADGTEKILLVLTAGWFFGETASLLSGPFRLYCVTEEKTELLFIPLEAFRQLLGESPEFNAAILNSQARKNAMLCREIESQAFYTCKDRLLQLFYYSADTSFAFDGKWYPLKHNYTQQELGTILGVSRVTISKFINEFCNDGVIRIVNRRMQINIGHYNQLDGALSAG